MNFRTVRPKQVSGEGERVKYIYKYCSKESAMSIAAIVVKYTCRREYGTEIYFEADVNRKAFCEKHNTA